jgi:AraC family transcriptional regulator
MHDRHLTTDVNPEIDSLRSTDMDHFDAQAQRIDYLAGVSVSTLSAALPEGMVQLTIPRAEYAVFDAALASLGEVFGFIYGQWLPGATMRQAAGPYFERYGPAFDPANPNSPIEIFIPLERAA